MGKHGKVTEVKKSTMDATDYTISFPAKPRPITLEQAARKMPPMQITDSGPVILSTFPFEDDMLELD